MKLILKILLPLFITSLASSPIESSNNKFKLETLWKQDALCIVPLDVNNDKQDELLICNSDLHKYFILYYDQSLSAFGQFNFKDPCRPLGGWDIDGDGTKEIFVRVRRKHTEYLEIFDSQYHLVRKIKTVTGQDLNGNGYWDGTISMVGTIDVNDDSRLDAIVVVGANFDLKPRGLYAYDLATDEELWHFLIGPHLRPLPPIDIDGDGFEDIVLGTIAYANGNEANGTDDSLTYVFAIDRKGQLMWRHDVGEYYSETLVAVSDVDLDGNKEVVVAERTFRAGAAEPDRIMILDGKTGMIEKIRKVGDRFRGMALGDLNRDTKDEIILGNTDGYVRVFDANLDEIGNYYHHSETGWIEVADLDGNGTLEVVLTTKDNNVLVLDEHLNQLACEESEEYSGGPYITLVQFGNKRKLLLGPRGLSEKPAKFFFLEFKKEIFAPMELSNTWIFISIFGFIAVVVVLYTQLSKRNKLNQTALVHDLIRTSKAGHIFIDFKGVIKSMNQVAEKILKISKEHLIGENYSTALDAENLKPLVKFISNALKADKNFASEKLFTDSSAETALLAQVSRLQDNIGYIITLEDLTTINYIKQVEAWAPVAQRLAHSIKNPLTTIMLSVQRLQKLYHDKGKTKKLNGYTDSILDEIERLRKMSDAFMKFANLQPPKLKPEDINATITALVKKIEAILPTSEIKIKLDLEKKLPAINLDKEQMSNALYNIIENAVTAAKNKGGDITISTTLIEKFPESSKRSEIQKWIEIEITDTGSGIPEKYIPKVFQPYFSLKPGGTGLGLYIAKRIIEAHHGSIELSSKQNVGTTVTIQLPIVATRS